MKSCALNSGHLSLWSCKALTSTQFMTSRVSKQCNNSWWDRQMFPEAWWLFTSSASISVQETRQHLCLHSTSACMHSAWQGRTASREPRYAWWLSKPLGEKKKAPKLFGEVKETADLSLGAGEDSNIHTCFISILNRFFRDSSKHRSLEWLWPLYTTSRELLFVVSFDVLAFNSYCHTVNILAVHQMPNAKICILLY